jgi:hypothetical protein
VLDPYSLVNLIRIQIQDFTNPDLGFLWPEIHNFTDEIFFFSKQQEKHPAPQRKHPACVWDPDPWDPYVFGPFANTDEGVRRRGQMINEQCCRSGSGIRCLFDPGSGFLNRLFPDPVSRISYLGSQIQILLLLLRPYSRHEMATCVTRRRKLDEGFEM